MALRHITVAMLILYALLTVYPIFSLTFGFMTPRFLTPIFTSVGFFAMLPWVIAGWLKTT